MRNLADMIMVIDDVLTHDQCDAFIEKFNLTELDEVTKRVSNFSWEQDYRLFEELNITKHEDWTYENAVMFDKLCTIYPIYKTHTQSEFLLPLGACGFEAARMKKYLANDEDQFGWHADVGDATSAKRQLAMFTYLNDVEEGGETVFSGLLAEDDTQGLRIKPKAGRSVIFPPMWMYPHKGLKPVSGPKYIISQYVHYL